MYLYRILVLLLAISLSVNTQLSSSVLLQHDPGVKDRKEMAHEALMLSQKYLSVNLDSAKIYAFQALLYTHDVSDSLLIRTHDQLAKYYFYKNIIDSSIWHFQYAQSIAKENNYLSLHSSLGIGLGSAFLRQGKYEMAIETLVSCAQYFEGIKDETNAAKSYANIATAHAELHNYDQAIQYSQQA